MHFGVIHFKSCKENYQSAQVPSLGPQVWVSADQIKLPGRFYFGRWVTRKRTPSSGFFFSGRKRLTEQARGRPKGMRGQREGLRSMFVLASIFFDD